RNVGLFQVEGWGIDQELADLFILIDEFQARNGVRGPFCEIGVPHGPLLILVGFLSKPRGRTVRVNLFSDAPKQNLDASGSGSYAKVRENIARHAPHADFAIVKGNSCYLAPTDVAKLQGCRLMHIDGGHLTEVVLNDLTLAQSTIGVGGVIVIDD